MWTFTRFLTWIKARPSILVCTLGNPSSRIAQPYVPAVRMSSRYAEAHKSPKGPGDARPTALQIVGDEGLEGKLSNKVVLITGCSSGLGTETARAVATTGARVFCGVRNVDKGESALAGVLNPGQVELLKIDLSSLNSVRAATEEFKNKSNTLNILINNAG